MSRKVTYVKLNGTFFIPGIGNMKDSLPPDNKTLKDFEMSIEERGDIILSFTEKPGVKKTVGIGASSVMVYVLAEESPDSEE